MASPLSAYAAIERHKENVRVFLRGIKSVFPDIRLFVKVDQHLKPNGAEDHYAVTTKAVTTARDMKWEFVIVIAPFDSASFVEQMFAEAMVKFRAEVNSAIEETCNEQ